jgi:transposase
VPGRSGAVLSSWLRGRDAGWRSGVAVAALDPFRGYATALRTHLPGAVRVLDAFHVIKLGFDAVDQVRRRVQQETLGHRGRAGDPLYGIRRVLRRGHDHHSDLSWSRLLRGLALGDPDGEVAATWIAAQDLRLLHRPRNRLFTMKRGGGLSTRWWAESASRRRSAAVVAAGSW